MPEIIPDYELVRPTAADLVASLEQILGADAAHTAVTHALREMGSEAASIAELSSLETLEFATLLIKQRGIISVVARSFSIRAHSYELLASQAPQRSAQ